MDAKISGELEVLRSRQLDVTLELPDVIFDQTVRRKRSKYYKQTQYYTVESLISDHLATSRIQKSGHN